MWSSVQDLGVGSPVLWGQHWLWNKPLPISSKSSGLLAAMQKQQGHLVPASPPYLTMP